MKFRESVIAPLGPAKFNLKDLVHTKEFVEFGPQHEAISTARYRELVEQRIQELTRINPILQKLRDGKEVSETEAEELAEQLHNEHPHITVELLRRVYNHRKAQLAQFIKHILGIEVLESFPKPSQRPSTSFLKHTVI